MTTATTASSSKETWPTRVLFVGGAFYVIQLPFRFLIHSGVDVALATSGEEAWSFIEVGRVRFDVIIIDEETPKIGRMGSIELVTKLRSVRYSGAVILLADMTRPAELQSYRTLGVNGIIKKPVELWELQHSLEVAQPVGGSE